MKDSDIRLIVEGLSSAPGKTLQVLQTKIPDKYVLPIEVVTALQTLITANDPAFAPIAQAILARTQRPAVVQPAGKTGQEMLNTLLVETIEPQETDGGPSAPQIDGPPGTSPTPTASEIPAPPAAKAVEKKKPFRYDPLDEPPATSPGKSADRAPANPPDSKASEAGSGITSHRRPPGEPPQRPAPGSLLNRPMGEGPLGRGIDDIPEFECQLSWEHRDEVGLFPAMWKSVVEILGQPIATFSNLQPKGNAFDSYLFGFGSSLSVLGLFSMSFFIVMIRMAGFRAILSVDAFGAFLKALTTSVIGLSLGIYILVWCVHITLSILGSAEDGYLGTFRGTNYTIGAFNAIAFVSYALFILMSFVYPQGLAYMMMGGGSIVGFLFNLFGQWIPKAAVLAGVGWLIVAMRNIHHLQWGSAAGGVILGLGLFYGLFRGLFYLMAQSFFPGKLFIVAAIALFVYFLGRMSNDFE